MNSKIILFIFYLCFISLFVSCSKDIDEGYLPNKSEIAENSTTGNLPDGCFEVNFSTSAFDPVTRAPVNGQDSRVQHIRYVIYKSTGEYVKEKVILLPSQGTPSWPLQMVRDTLPKGTYKAVFLGNIEKTLFPYSSGNSSPLYADVLTNYKSDFSNARIVLPPTEFSSNSEYYWANTTFSDAAPNPTVLLQRIIGGTKLKRVFVDATTALESLVNNIVTQINYKNIIRTNVQALLPGLVKTALQNSAVGALTWSLLGGVDAVTNAVVAALVEPVTNALYDQFVQKLVEQIGLALVGNTNKTDLLAFLARALNPWSDNLASAAVVSIYDFPKTMDFNLNVIDKYAGLNKFKYSFTAEGNERYILLKGFNANYDIRKINVVGQGLISGVVVDQVIDTYLLPGAFVDINDPINVTGDKRNYRYYSNYAFASLGLKSYTQQTDGNHSLTLSVRVGDIANIDDILGRIPLLSTILSLVSGPIKNIIVTTSVNLPLLGIDNLTVSGGWNPLPAVQY